MINHDYDWEKRLGELCSARHQAEKDIGSLLNNQRLDVIKRLDDWTEQDRLSCLSPPENCEPRRKIKIQLVLLVNELRQLEDTMESLGVKKVRAPAAPWREKELSTFGVREDLNTIPCSNGVSSVTGGSMKDDGVAGD